MPGLGTICGLIAFTVGNEEKSIYGERLGSRHSFKDVYHSSLLVICALVVVVFPMTMLGPFIRVDPSNLIY